MTSSIYTQTLCFLFCCCIPDWFCSQRTFGCHNREVVLLGGGQGCSKIPYSAQHSSQQTLGLHAIGVKVKKCCSEQAVQAPVQILGQLVLSSSFQGHLSTVLPPFSLLFFFFSFFVFLKSVLSAIATPDPSCVYDPHHSSRHCQILNLLSGARHPTFVFMDASQIHFCWATKGTPLPPFL